jgi:hypothetical protein
MQNINKRTCYMKATRGGFSEIEILKSLHGMIYGRYKEGVLYMFPTTDDVGEFSKSRFNPLLLANRQTIGKYVKPGGRGTDTTSLKKIHNAFLYLRGARLSQKLGDESESAKMKSIGVDKIVFDEVDHMDEKVIAKARGRYYDSPWQEEVFIGNPIIPDLGVDKQWQLSDQRHWHRKCKHCDKWTCAELFFMEDPERCIGIRKDGTGYIACKNCGREIFIRDGEWQPSIKENTEYMRGYRWSQLTSAVCDPLDILKDFKDPPEGNLADVYRLRLGLPYISEEDRLTPSQVYNCCGHETMPTSHRGPCAMGVDVGKIKHVVIGARTGTNSYSVFKTARLSEWPDIHDLAEKFNVKIGVVDAGPDFDMARDFQRTEPYRIFLCYYKEDSPHDYVFNNKTGIVSANRTQIFDATHRFITTIGVLTIPRRCPEVEKFVKQVCAAYKILEMNKRTNQSVYRYKGSNEHYRNALNYFYLAAHGGKISSVSNRKKRLSHAISSEV